MTRTTSAPARCRKSAVQGWRKENEHSQGQDACNRESEQKIDAMTGRVLDVLSHRNTRCSGVNASRVDGMRHHLLYEPCVQAIVSCRWRRKRGPKWRVEKRHWCGYAMDFGSVLTSRIRWRYVSETPRGCRTATSVALRQLDDLPLQAWKSSSGTRSPDHDLRKSDGSQRKSFGMARFFS